MAFKTLTMSLGSPLDLAPPISLASGALAFEFFRYTILTTVFWSFPLRFPLPPLPAPPSSKNVSSASWSYFKCCLFYQSLTWPSRQHSGILLLVLKPVGKQALCSSSSSTFKFMSVNVWWLSSLPECTLRVLWELGTCLLHSCAFSLIVVLNKGL